MIGCTKKEPQVVETAVVVDREEINGILEPLPESLIDTSDKTNVAKIALGKKLYFEKALSVADDISCNSCHNLETFGVDNQPTSPGHKGQRGDRNSPTVLNAGLHIAQFWDGRAEDLAAQAIGPILNPAEMAMPSEKAVLDKISKIDGYLAMFKAAFPKEKDSFSYKNLGRAIAAFEKTLLTPSRFDKFLKGDDSALTNAEKKGLNTFVSVGCISCHSGAAIGGGMYQKIGAVEEYHTEDMGRFNVTKDPEDKKVFKVPSLRNITKTAPYFHDGSVATLEKAVKLMGKHQLGVNLTDTQISEIVTFLDSLTGKVESK